MTREPLDVLQYAYLPYPEDKGSNKIIIDDPTRGLFVFSDKKEEMFELVVAHSVGQALELVKRLNPNDKQTRDELLETIRSCSLQSSSREAPRTFQGFVGGTIGAALQEGMEFMDHERKLHVDVSMSCMTLGVADESESNYTIVCGFIDDKIGYATHIVFSMTDLDYAIRTTKWTHPFNDAERTTLLLEMAEHLPETHHEPPYFIGGRQALGIGLGLPIVVANNERERALDEVRAQGLVPITPTSGRFQA